MLSRRGHSGAVILAAAEGVASSQIARGLGISRPLVLLWRQRFAARSPNGLTDIKPGRGRKPAIPAAKVRAIVNPRVGRQRRPLQNENVLT